MKKKCEFCEGKGYINEFNDISNDISNDIESKDNSKQRLKVPSIILVITVVVGIIGGATMYIPELFELFHNEEIESPIEILAAAEAHGVIYLSIQNWGDEDVTLTHIKFNSGVTQKEYKLDMIIKKGEIGTIGVPTVSWPPGIEITGHTKTGTFHTSYY